jgi:ArsR family transcriptional regulator
MNTVFIRVLRRDAVLIVVNMTTRLMVVNIENGRYAGAMPRTRTTNPDPEVRLLAALADPTRLAIVRQLAQEQETCACDFTACCDVGQPTVSHHLRVLREAGIVTSERRGQWIWYHLAPETAERLTSIARSLVPGGLITVSDLVTRRKADATAAQPVVS